MSPYRLLRYLRSQVEEPDVIDRIIQRDNDLKVPDLSYDSDDTVDYDVDYEYAKMGYF